VFARGHLQGTRLLDQGLHDCVDFLLVVFKVAGRVDVRLLEVEIVWVVAVADTPPMLAARALAHFLACIVPFRPLDQPSAAFLVLQKHPSVPRNVCNAFTFIASTTLRY